MEKRIDEELKSVMESFPETEIRRDNVVAVRNETNEAMSGAGQPVDESENLSFTSYDQWIPGPEGDPEVRIRIYQPKEKDQKPGPGILFMHGGGFILGSVDIDDQSCRQLVEALSVPVVSVDYRLAPENPFPAGLEDCYATLKWMSENASELGIDASQIIIHGGSAGGGLTAGLSLLARDRKGPHIAYQVPICPMIDNRGTSQSSNEITDKRVWNGEQNALAWEMYLGPDYENENVSPYAAPLHAEDYTGLPPTYLNVGELDPFRDETMEYAAKLTKAGVPTELHLYPGAFHAFDYIAQQTSIGNRGIKDTLSAMKRIIEHISE